MHMTLMRNTMYTDRICWVISSKELAVPGVAVATLQRLTLVGEDWCAW